jgi:hypothetical protein
MDDSSYDLAPSEPATPRVRLTHPSPAPAAAAPPSPPAASGVLPGNICSRCGFRTFGKPATQCPRCAAPMESGAADRLKFADPTWLVGVAAGMTLILPGVVGHVVAAVLRYGNLRAAALVHLAAAGLVAGAVWKATRAAPGERPDGLAKTAWGAAAAAVALWAVVCLPALHLLPREVAKPLVLLTMIDHAVLAVALGFYVSGLAARLPDDTLTAHSLHTGWLVAAVCGTCFGIQLLELTTFVHLMFYFCSFPLIFGLLVILAWGMVTLARVAASLRSAADEARAVRAVAARLERA